MADENENSTTEVEGQEPNEETAANKLEDLPDWAQKEIKNLRNENASRRTQLQETRKQLEDAKTPEDFAKLTQDFGKTLSEKDRSIAALTHGLPEDLATRIKGESLDDMLKDAEFLAGLVKPAAPKETPREPQRPERLTGGLTPPDGQGTDAKQTPADLADAAWKVYKQGH